MIDQLWSLWYFVEPYIDWFAMGFGILGAIIVAYPTNNAKVKGFEFWVYANVLWCITAILLRNLPLLILNIVYCGCNIVGIWKHLPLADAERKLKEDLLQIPKKE